MTATIAPLTVFEDHGGNRMRMLSVSVNLLPEEVVTARAARSARRLTIAVLVVVALAVGAWYYSGRSQAADANDQLAAVQAQSQQLITAQQKFTTLDTTKADIDSLKSELATATTGDVVWSTVIDNIRAAAPRGISFTGFTATSADATQVPISVPADSSTGSTGSTDGTAATGSTSTGSTTSPAVSTPSGSIVITGTAPSKPFIAALLLNLGHIRGVSDAFLTSVASDQQSATLTFSIEAATTAAALNHRFTDGVH